MTQYQILFDPLWKTLVDRRMNKSELAKISKLSRTTIAKLTKNESVTLDVIGRICAELKCGVEDVLEIRLSSQPQASTLSPSQTSTSTVEKGKTGEDGKG